MSRRLFDLNPELKRLRDEGYNVQISNGFLIMHDVPYVNSAKQVKRGFLATPLLLANDKTQPPDSHTIHFGGEYPCDQFGHPIERIRNNDSPVRIAEKLIADRTFSAKPQPTGRYESYYAKITTYADIVGGPARQLDPSVTANTFPVIVAEDTESVFHYLDTASSRAEIIAISEKLKVRRVAVVGLGGTGGYVLDLLAKTPVQEIHLFDGDVFFQHNAFRAPGAASGHDLEQKPKKVDYFRQLYDKMRKGIIAHPEYITSGNLNVLEGFDFVLPQPSLQGDTVTVIKVSPDRPARSPLTLPIATGPALAAAARLPKQHRRGGKAAARKAAATVARKRADAAIAARKQNRTPNGSPASFTPLPEFDEAAAIKFRQQLSKDYQHPHAASAAVVKDESVAEKSIQPCHDDELVVSDVNAFRASLPSDYATPTKKSPE